MDAVDAAIRVADKQEDRGTIQVALAGGCIARIDVPLPMHESDYVRIQVALVQVLIGAAQRTSAQRSSLSVLLVPHG